MRGMGRALAFSHGRNYGHVSARGRCEREVQMAEDEGFRGPQVCKIVGITYRQLDYWARTDLIRPSIADAQGSGTQRRYSYRDLVELKVIKGLLDAGVALQSARKAVEYLRTTWATTSRRPPWSPTGRGRCWSAPTASWSTWCGGARACSASWPSAASRRRSTPPSPTCRSRGQACGRPRPPAARPPPGGVGQPVAEGARALAVRTTRLSGDRSPADLADRRPWPEPVPGRRWPRRPQPGRRCPTP